MSKYNPLTKWLRNNDDDTITLSTSAIQTIIESELPVSAYTYTAWWANDLSHSQGRSWLEAGYSVTNASQVSSTHKVIFSKKDKTKKHTHPAGVIKKKREVVTKHQVAKITVQFDSNETLLLDGYTFFSTPFIIYKKDLPSPFLEYKRHTVDNLLKKKHYLSLRHTIERGYPQFLHKNIQNFMRYLVQNNDHFFRRFLNKYGADDFCHYGLTDENIFYKKGLYLYHYEGEVVYIGRCRDNYHSRFNINYGKIHPINCYKEGQATNTRMNSLMNRYGEKIKIFLCPLTSDDEICTSEKVLIDRFKPKWNLSR